MKKHLLTVFSTILFLSLSTAIFADFPKGVGIKNNSNQTIFVKYCLGTNSTCNSYQIQKIDAGFTFIVPGSHNDNTTKETVTEVLHVCNDSECKNTIDRVPPNNTLCAWYDNPDNYIPITLVISLNHYNQQDINDVYATCQQINGMN